MALARHNRTDNPYLVPIKSDGTYPAAAPSTDATVTGDGVYTLAAGTYLYSIYNDDSSMVAFHIQWDADAALTSVTVEDTCFPESEVTDYDIAQAGAWIDEDPTTAFVGTVSSGTTVSNGVVAHTAGAVGGAMFHISNTGALRTRLKVVCGTGGQVRVAAWGK